MCDRCVHLEDVFSTDLPCGESESEPDSAPRCSLKAEDATKLLQTNTFHQVSPSARTVLAALLWTLWSCLSSTFTKCSWATCEYVSTAFVSRKRWRLWHKCLLQDEVTHGILLWIQLQDDIKSEKGDFFFLFGHPGVTPTSVCLVHSCKSCH